MFLFYLSKDLSMGPLMAWDTQKSVCLCFPSASIKDMLYYTMLLTLKSITYSNSKDRYIKYKTVIYTYLIIMKLSFLCKYCKFQNKFALAYIVTSAKPSLSVFFFLIFEVIIWQITTFIPFFFSFHTLPHDSFGRLFKFMAFFQ